ncbi:hypothetical protein [Streptomyces sp. DH37]|uniref:hypothetical protein n=1 Tax=Streptomyces sp. DH37 TaxID=3040122 RepID=UPI002441F6C6|nr:hypothetical protein [Streptomyces sp. DH37]MDG9700871.1 hypothetical protein [Streptomyces sp. DH37]
MTRASAALAVLSVLAAAAEAAIPLTAAEAATGVGARPFAASVLRALSGGALVSAACVAQSALLVLFVRGVRLCRGRLRGRAPGPRTG